MNDKFELIASIILYSVTLLAAILFGIIGAFWQTDILLEYIIVKISSSILLLGTGFVIGTVFVVFQMR